MFIHDFRSKILSFPNCCCNLKLFGVLSQSETNSSDIAEPKIFSAQEHVSVCGPEALSPTSKKVYSQCNT